MRRRHSVAIVVFSLAPRIKRIDVTTISPKLHFQQRREKSWRRSRGSWKYSVDLAECPPRNRVKTRKCTLCPSRASELATLLLPVQFITFRHPRAFLERCFLKIQPSCSSALE